MLDTITKGLHKSKLTYTPYAGNTPIPLKEIEPLLELMFASVSSENAVKITELMSDHSSLNEFYVDAVQRGLLPNTIYAHMLTALTNDNYYGAIHFFCEMHGMQYTNAMGDLHKVPKAMVDSVFHYVNKNILSRFCYCLVFPSPYNSILAVDDKTRFEQWIERIVRGGMLSFKPYAFIEDDGPFLAVKYNRIIKFQNNRFVILTCEDPDSVYYAGPYVPVDELVGKTLKADGQCLLLLALMSAGNRLTEFTKLLRENSAVIMQYLRYVMDSFGICYEHVELARSLLTPIVSPCADCVTTEYAVVNGNNNVLARVHDTADFNIVIKVPTLGGNYMESYRVSLSYLVMPPTHSMSADWSAVYYAGVLSMFGIVLTETYAYTTATESSSLTYMERDSVRPIRTYTDVVELHDE